MRCLSRSLKSLGRSVGRLNRKSIAQKCMRDRKIKKNIFDLLSKDIQHELTKMCSGKSASPFRTSSRADLEDFSWISLTSELEKKAPTLHSVLQICTNVKRRIRPLRTPWKRPSNNVILCVCACIILRHRSQQMNTLQKIVSLILHRGGASKQVELFFLPLLIYFTIMFHTGRFISAYRDCYYALAINMSSISLTSWEGIMIQTYSTGWKPYRGQ